ncbi:hypothetical protein DFH29DRAFT_874011 [Suillus ampliporus]|nr:hypothetical protein DFH29DRAFT_874011 [Suillus ampliporus]
MSAIIRSIFHPCIVTQRSSTELLVYSREVGQLVMIAYPVSYRGQRIVPEGVFDFLHRCSLTWECFCSLISGQPTPARFVNEFISGHTVVRCHHVDNHCGFYLNIDSIYLTTFLESRYEHLPTLLHGHVPDMVSLVAAFRSTPPAELGDVVPTFVGYCSFHETMFPGYPQLRGGLSHVPRFVAGLFITQRAHRLERSYMLPRRMLTQSASANVAQRRVSSHVAGPSCANIPQPSEHQQDLLVNLLMGMGVSHYDSIGLLEWQRSCGVYGIRTCSYLVFTMAWQPNGGGVVTGHHIL